jgi:spore coat protein H
MTRLSKPWGLLLATMLPLVSAPLLAAPTIASSHEAEPGADTTVTDLYLYMERDDLELLYSRDIFSGDRLPGYTRLAPDSQEIQELRGLRFRGNTTRYSPKKSFNIRFEDRQEFLFGTSRMNLNGMFTDPAAMREQIAWNMFRRLDHPAPLSRYFNLHINDIYEGLYVHISRVDGDLLERAGLNPDGTLVRDQLRRSDDPDVAVPSIFGFDIDTIPAAEQADFLDSNFNSRGNPDWQAVADFSRWVRDTPAGDAFAQGFEQQVDVDNFIDWLAVHFLIGDIDSFGDDYWMHIDSEDPEGRWRFIPWDKDLSFGAYEREHPQPSLRQQHDFFVYEFPLSDANWGNDLITKFLETPQLRDRLHARLQTLMTEQFTVDYFRTKANNLAAVVAPYVDLPAAEGRFFRHPRNHYGELGHHDLHVEALLDFVALRYQFLDQQLNPQAGERYTATVDLSNYEPGDTVMLTDAMGWTIAQLDLVSMSDPAMLTVQVEPLSEDLELSGINRVWTIDTQGAEVEAELTMFYRNDLSQFGRDNWYSAPVAVGDQWDLVVAAYDGAATMPMSSRVNPFSNKVQTSLTLQGSQQFVVIHD